MWPGFMGASFRQSSRANDRGGALEHDPEKWIPVFRKDHAPPKIWSAMTIQLKAIALYCPPLAPGPKAGPAASRADRDLKFHEDPSRTRHRPDRNHRETC